MAAWSTMPVPTWFPPDHAQPTDERQLWEWLWFTVEPDFDDLATRAGVTPITAKNKFLMLKAARLIYPDGEVNEWGLALLRSDIAKALKAPAKAKKR